MERRTRMPVILVNYTHDTKYEMSTIDGWMHKYFVLIHAKRALCGDSNCNCKLIDRCYFEGKSVDLRDDGKYLTMYDYDGKRINNRTREFRSF